MFKSFIKKSCVLALSLTLLITGSSSSAIAKKTAKPSKKTITIKVGEKKTITIKNKNKKAKYSFTSSAKKIAFVNKKGVVTGKKAGKAVISVKEKFGKKTKSIGKVTVKVNDIKQNTTTIPVQTSQSANPTEAAKTVTSTPTVEPTATPTKEPIVYPSSHDAPSDFDQTKNGVDYGKTQKVTYYSSVTGKNRKVNIITPPGYNEDEKYPVIYLLHGIGGNEDEWLDGKPAQIVGNLIDSGEAEKMIIVIPNVRAGADDSYPADAFNLEHFAKFDNFTNDLSECLMPFMEENYSVATGRENTAICGLSMGGRESLYIGLNKLEDFGYIAALSPGYGVFEYEANGVHEPGLFTEETMTVPEEYRNNTFLLIVNGIDEGGESALGGTVSKALKANGVNHWFYTTPGAHNFTTWKNGLYNFAKCIFK